MYTGRIEGIRHAALALALAIGVAVTAHLLQVLICLMFALQQKLISAERVGLKETECGKESCFIFYGKLKI